VGVGAFGGFVAFTGEDFEAFDPGPGIGGFLYYTLTGRVRIGGGAQYASNSFETVIEIGDQRFPVQGNTELFSVYLEPSFQLPLENMPGLTPFAAIRFSWAQRRIPQTGAPVDPVKATGFGIGGAAGVRIRVASRLAIEPAVSYDVIRLGNANVGGVTIPESSTNGGWFVARVALVVRFGS
jgi:hypothetical protein